MGKYNKYILIMIIVIVLAMSIGYSVLNSELHISGEVNYRPEEDVRITNFTTNNKPSEMTIEYSDFSKHEVKLGYTTTGSCSITYTVEVKNSSGVNMGILEIGGLDDNVEVQENILGTKLVGSADTQTFTITFNSNGEETKTYLLTFDFEQVYTITYNSFDNTENYKKEILKGEEYSQNFGDNYPTNIEVKMNGVYLKNYTYSNGTLIIPNVTGNLVITGIYAPSYTDNSEANKPELNGDMIPVVYDEKNKTWVKQDLDKSYDYSKQIWANAVTVKNTVKDLSGNNNDGLIRGNAIVGNGEAYLDGVDDHINAGLANYNFKNNITLILKFKFNDIPQGNNIHLFGNWEGGGGGFYYIKSDSSFNIELFDGTYHSTTFIKDIKINEYYTLVGTYNGVSTSLYLNGEKLASNDISINIKQSKIGFAIGGNPYGNSNNTSVSDASNITVSDALIFDKGLTEEEVKKHYSNEVTLGETKPLVYYNFEDANREYYKKADIGTPINMDDINTMWVWIPRYSYTIKSEDGVNYFGKASSENKNPTQALPGEIDIKFLSKTALSENGKAQYTGDENKEWRTPEAFNFGGTTQAGIWVGKFETTGELASACTSESCAVDKLSIKPDTPSLISQSVSSFFYAARSMQNDTTTFGFSDSGDLHMMKNDEWGAVAYLSQSRYGKHGNTDYTGKYEEIYQNKSNTFITGSSNGTPSQSETATKQYAYNDMTELGDGQGQAGPGASTTGNIYGIYDMSGGAWEYVMGVLAYYEIPYQPMSGQSPTLNSGFTGKVYQNNTYEEFENITFPDKKYYDFYIVGTTRDTMPTSSTLANSVKACSEGICYGQALSETSGWYGDWYGFVYRESPWSARGGGCSDSTAAGVFYSNNAHGPAGSYYGSRFVFAP